MDMIESIRRLGMKPQEVLAVKEGVKPMLRGGTIESGIKEINKFCRENELHCTITPFNIPSGIKSEEQRYSVLISKSKRNVEEYYDIEKKWKLGADHIMKTSELLGYPKCCIDFYTQFKRQTSQDNNVALLVRILNKSKNKPSFYLNNVFNFDSRAGGLIRNKPIEVNPFYFLISHIPCSYNCEKSIEYAKSVLGILRKDYPEFAKEILHHIRRPVLFFDDFNWVVFDGEVKGNEIHYREIVYHCLDSKELLEKLKSSSSVKVDRDNPGKGVIFDFG